MKTKILTLFMISSLSAFSATCDKVHDFIYGVEGQQMEATLKYKGKIEREFEMLILRKNLITKESAPIFAIGNDEHHYDIAMYAGKSIEVFPATLNSQGSGTNGCNFSIWQQPGFVYNVSKITKKSITMKGISGNEDISLTLTKTNNNLREVLNDLSEREWE